MLGSNPVIEHAVDVCVIGGGMAGICASIAAARNGAVTMLVHDRPVLGGNASSEIRMWICGAHGKDNKETGILEELQLENQYRNHGLNYSVWDSVLYGAVEFESGIGSLLNSTVLNAESENNLITEITAWQLTTQTWHRIRAKLFIDCSGDSILSTLTPAEFRVGREASSEFGEDIEPAQADNRTMGNSLLIQMRRTDEPQTFIPPKWAYKFRKPDDLPHRIDGVNGHNFWWIEVGGLNDTIRDAEAIRDELMRITYGVVDYIKNRAPESEKAANWAVEWVGSLPGKRENRRYIGDYTLTQNDIVSGGKFEDIVAYGGWSMDDHHPAGIYYPGEPTIFHPAPSPYGIPYRCLYSLNISNLLFAGRNISVTHAALSSTRVMATCALLGQSAGTAAAICIAKDIPPRALSDARLMNELQGILMDDDCWLPGLTRRVDHLATSAMVTALEGNPGRLVDGIDRNRNDEPHCWTGATGSYIEFRWNEPVVVRGARIVFDSNLSHGKQMPYSYPQRGSDSRVPDTIVRKFRIEALGEDNSWNVVFSDDNNYQRLRRPRFEAKTRAVRFFPEATWGSGVVNVFAFEPLHDAVKHDPVTHNGSEFSEARRRISPDDLRPPSKSSKESKPALARPA